MERKREFSGAALVPTTSLEQFVIGQLLAGLFVKVTIDGQPCKGYVHQLDFAKGGDHVFASVSVPDPANQEDSIYVRVSIGTDGTVTVMPNQPED